MAKFKIGDKVYYKFNPNFIGVVNSIRYSTEGKYYFPIYKVEFENNRFAFFNEKELHKYDIGIKNLKEKLTEISEYCDNDALVTEDIFNHFNTRYGIPTVPGINKVIFNNPATIVFWNDGTKTIVKCKENDSFDPEKGLAMAIAKYHFGNDNTFHKVMKSWLPKEEKTNDSDALNEYGGVFSENLLSLLNKKGVRFIAKNYD